MRALSAVLALALAAALVPLAPPEAASAHAGNSIALIGAWDGRLADGLTYKISGGDADIREIIRGAVEDWEDEVGGLVLDEVSGNTKAEINVKYKPGGGFVQGHAVTKGRAFITGCDLNVSGKVFGIPNGPDTLAQIARHEFGHCLGIGHANFAGDLMAGTLGDEDQISACDVEAVEAAQHWFLEDGVTTPHAPHVTHVHC
jgi:hypothetical protein